MIQKKNKVFFKHGAIQKTTLILLLPFFGKLKEDLLEIS
jgi:hypothetical protein